MELNVSAGQEQKQRMDTSIWSSTVVAITLGHPWGHFVHLFFTVSPSPLSPYNSLCSVSDTSSH